MNYHASCVYTKTIEWITRIWCLDSPWAFWGPLAARYTIRRFLSKLSQHPLGSVQRFFWHGRVATKNAVQGPADWRNIFTGSVFIRKGAESYLYVWLKKIWFRGVCTFLSSVFERISRLTFYCQAVWNHQNALAEWCRSLFVSSKCGHFRIRIFLLVALLAPGRVPTRQENSLRPGPNVALNFESETLQKIGIAPDWGCILCLTLVVGCDVCCFLIHHCKRILSLQCLNDLRQPMPLLLPRIAMSSARSLYSAPFIAGFYYYWFALHHLTLEEFLPEVFLQDVWTSHKKRFAPHLITWTC